MNLSKTFKLFLVFILFAIGFNFYSLGQSSLDGMKYQAIIRDANGNVLGDQNIELKFIIYRKSFPISYEENHIFQTNQLGLVNLEIGLGTSIIVGDFKTIDWNLGTLSPYFILVQLRRSSS